MTLTKDGHDPFEEMARQKLALQEMLQEAERAGLSIEEMRPQRIVPHDEPRREDYPNRQQFRAALARWKKSPAQANRKDR